MDEIAATTTMFSSIMGLFFSTTAPPVFKFNVQGKIVYVNFNLYIHVLYSGQYDVVLMYCQR